MKKKPLELHIYQEYFDLIATGQKTTEVRVKYPYLARLTVGDLIRFCIKDTRITCDVRVTHIHEYPDFDTLLDAEGIATVNPRVSRAEQLVKIRKIYTHEKEALGALAIGIKLIQP